MWKCTVTLCVCILYTCCPALSIPVAPPSQYLLPRPLSTCCPALSIPVAPPSQYLLPRPLSTCCPALSIPVAPPSQYLLPRPHSTCCPALSIPVAPPSQYLLPRPPQATRKPLAAAEVNEIFELTRENGILVGKGGLYGSVRKTTLNI